MRLSYAVGIYQLLSNLDRFYMSFLFRFAGCANRLYELRIVCPIGCGGRPDGGFQQPTRPNAACSTDDFSPIVYYLHCLLLCRIGWSHCVFRRSSMRLLRRGLHGGLDVPTD